MREARAEKDDQKHMTNAETTTTVTVAEQAANVAPAKPSSKKSASPKKSAPKAKKAAKPTKPAKKAPKPAADRSNKKAEVIAMMKRAKGVTLAEIMTYASHCTSLG